MHSITVQNACRETTLGMPPNGIKTPNPRQPNRIDFATHGALGELKVGIPACSSKLNGGLLMTAHIAIRS